MANKQNESEEILTNLFTGDPSGPELFKSNPDYIIEKTDELQVLLANSPKFAELPDHERADIAQHLIDMRNACIGLYCYNEALYIEKAGRAVNGN